MGEKALSLMGEFLPDNMDMIDLMILFGSLTLACYMIERRHKNV